MPVDIHAPGAVMGVFRPRVCAVLGLALLATSAWTSARTTFDIETSAASTISSGTDDDRLGSSLAVLGDINGDGIDDLLVGAPASGASSRAYVVFGRSRGLPPQIDVAHLSGGEGFVLKFDRAPSQLGFAVTRLGDVNGDGRVDFAVGAYLADVDTGAVTIYGAGVVGVVFGRAAEDRFPAVLDLDALDGNDGFLVEGALSDGRIGYAVADAGDFDGDGHDDILIGALSGGGSQSAWIVRGRSGVFPARIDLGGLVTSGAGFELTGTDDTGFASAVAGLGDLDGDGRSEVAVGAPGVPVAGGLPDSVAGRVYVIHGRVSTAGTGNVLDLDASSTSGIVRLDGSIAGDRAGSAIATAGDVNADGVPDLLIGAPGRSAYTGAAYLVSGDAAASTDLDTLVASGAATRIIDATASNANNLVGASVAGGADLDDDGIPDLVVAMPGGAVVAGRNGNVYVLSGSGFQSTWPTEIDLASNADVQVWSGVMQADTSEPNLLRESIALATGGDANGDGVPELLIGSPRADASDPLVGPWQGKAWLTVGPPYDDGIFSDGFELPSTPP